jgi:hypothetical protein
MSVYTYTYICIYIYLDIYIYVYMAEAFILGAGSTTSLPVCMLSMYVKYVCMHTSTYMCI